MDADVVLLLIICEMQTLAKLNPIRTTIFSFSCTFTEILAKSIFCDPHHKYGGFLTGALIVALPLSSNSLFLPGTKPGLCGEVMELLEFFTTSTA